MSIEKNIWRNCFSLHQKKMRKHQHIGPATTTTRSSTQHHIAYAYTYIFLVLSLKFHHRQMIVIISTKRGSLSFFALFRRAVFIAQCLSSSSSSSLYSFEQHQNRGSTAHRCQWENTQYTSKEFRFFIII